MKERNYGLDVARIVAMLGIIVLHILGQGGVLNRCQLGSPQYAIAWWTEICAYTSVDIFALLSGWLGISKKNSSVYRAFELIATVFFYSLLITMAFMALHPAVIGGISGVVKGIIPALEGRYWYITCYIPLAILQPFVNSMLLSLSIKQHKVLCVLCVILFSLIPSVVSEDFFALGGGYSTFWLFIGYVIGAYLKRAEKTIQLPFGVAVGGFLVTSIILLIGDLVLGSFVGRKVGYFVEYTSPAILLMAVIVIILLKDARINRCKRSFSALAKQAFDVYILHCHILIFDYVLKDLFVFISEINFPLIPIVTILFAMFIYLVLCLVGHLRGLLFDQVHITSGLKSLARRIDKIIY